MRATNRPEALAMPTVGVTPRAYQTRPCRPPLILQVSGRANIVGRDILHGVWLWQALLISSWTGLSDPRCADGEHVGTRRGSTWLLDADPRVGQLARRRGSWRPLQRRGEPGRDAGRAARVL